MPVPCGPPSLQSLLFLALTLLTSRKVQAYLWFLLGNHSEEMVVLLHPVKAKTILLPFLNPSPGHPMKGSSPSLKKFPRNPQAESPPQKPIAFSTYFFSQPHP